MTQSSPLDDGVVEEFRAQCSLLVSMRFWWLFVVEGTMWLAMPSAMEAWSLIFYP
jgi:hypothetical protein